MRSVYFDCLSGASGNMLLGAFLDAGVPLTAVEEGMRALGIDERIRLRVDRRSKGALTGTHVEVEVIRPLAWSSVADIDRLIAAADRLDEGVRERSRLAFRLLAEGEARAHGVDVSRVHLHETGAVDAVVDVVGTFVAADWLQVEAFYCSALPYCVGQTESAHGVIPLPAPATVEILKAVGATTYRKDGEFELVTPTGAAILGACATFTSPRLVRDKEGYGAGTADLPWANVLRLVLGDVENPAASAPLIATEAPLVMPDLEPSAPDAEAPVPKPRARREPLPEPAAEPAAEPSLEPPAVVEVGTAPGVTRDVVSVIETNIDDMPPNLLADIPRAMLAAGALEAFLTPIVMKKGRAAHLLTVVCDGTLVESLSLKVLRETTTLGVRIREEHRLVAVRRVEVFESSLGALHVKVKEMDGRVVDATPEFDDVRMLAEDSEIALAEVHRRVQAEARQKYVDEG